MTGLHLGSGLQGPGLLVKKGLLALAPGKPCVGCCGGVATCCAPGRIYQYPSAVIEAGSGQLTVNHSTSFSFRRTVVREGSPTSRAGIIGGFSGVIRGGQSLAGPPNCLDMEGSASSSDLNVVGSNDAGQITREGWSATATAAVMPSLANVDAPGFENAALYTLARGFETPYPLIRISIQTVFNFFYGIDPDGGPNALLSYVAWGGSDFYLGFPCPGLVGFVSIAPPQTPPDPTPPLYGTPRTVLPGQQSSVATPIGVLSNIAPTLLIGGRTFTETESGPGFANLTRVETTLTHDRPDPDSLGVITASRTVTDIEINDNGVGPAERATNVWNETTTMDLSIEVAPGEFHRTFQRCPAYNAQVAARCSGLNISDCCAQSGEVCSKRLDQDPITHDLYLNSGVSLSLALDRDANQPDIIEARTNLPYDGAPGDTPGPGAAFLAGTVFNPVETCLPPLAPQPSLKLLTPLYGRDDAGFFTIWGEQTLQIVSDGLATGQRVRGAWSWISDGIKRYDQSVEEPTGNFIIASIRFIYTKDNGGNSNFDVAGSSFQFFGPTDPGWINSVAGAIVDITNEGPCIETVTVLTNNFVQTSTRLQKNDGSTVARFSAFARMVIDIQNLVECAVGARGLAGVTDGL